MTLIATTWRLIGRTSYGVQIIERVCQFCEDITMPPYGRRKKELWRVMQEEHSRQVYSDIDRPAPWSGNKIFTRKSLSDWAMRA